MGPVLASTEPAMPTRLIEYPSDLSGCSIISYGGRKLLYICSAEAGSTPFIVVLGFLCGQKQDIVTKDLIEPILEASRHDVADTVARSAPPECAGAQVFFL